MNISVPEKPTYYYEISSKSKWLLYWLPAKTLEKMISVEEVDKEILEDYPDGVDIKVTREDFSDFKRKYNMVLNVDPDAVWNAFLTLCVQDTETYHGVGYIEKEDLDPVVKAVNKELEMSGLAQQVPIAQEKDRTKRRKLHMQQVKINKQRMSLFKKITLPKVIKGKPILKQFAEKVRMSKGDEPYKAYLAIQQHKV